MQINEIKKLLYKEKPSCKFISANKAGLHYRTRAIEVRKEVTTTYLTFDFLIPFNEVGDATFGQYMESHLLIRYLCTDKPE
jgi:hypothetical protein